MNAPQVKFFRRNVGRFELGIAAMVVGLLLVFKYEETVNPHAAWLHVVTVCSMICVALELVWFAFKQWRKYRAKSSAE